MELLRLLTTVLASLPMVPLPSSTPLLTLLLAATSSNANQWAATADRLAPHGDGSKRRVLFPEETMAMESSASTTPCQNVLTTSPSHPYQAVTMSNRSNHNASPPAKPTVQS